MITYRLTGDFNFRKSSEINLYFPFNFNFGKYRPILYTYLNVKRIFEKTSIPKLIFSTLSQFER